MFFVKDIVDFEGVVEMSVSFISRGSRAELALGCRVPLMFKELQSSLNINRTSRSQLCMLLNTFVVNSS